MGARAFSHSGFFCGRRGARSIWTSSTELAIRVIRCESLLYDARAANDLVPHRGNLQSPGIGSKLQIEWAKTYAQSFDGYRLCMLRFDAGRPWRPQPC